jgi:hypothetical protein
MLGAVTTTPVPPPLTVHDISTRVTAVLLEIEAIARDLYRVPDVPPSAVETTLHRLDAARSHTALASVGIVSWPSLQGTWRRREQDH